MKYLSILFVVMYLVCTSVTAQTTKTKCELCSDVLEKEFSKLSISYSEQKIRNWLVEYFKATETTRRELKNNSSSDLELTAIIKTIPVKLGYSDTDSSEEGYWNSKYKEWQKTNFFSLDGIKYFYVKDSELIIKEWGNCMYDCDKFKALNVSNFGILVDIQKIRNGKYEIIIFNNSIADVQIESINEDRNIEIDQKDAINFKIGKVVTRKGGKVGAYFYTRNGEDADFDFKVILVEPINKDQYELSNHYRKPEKQSEVPIGTIIASTLSYEDFMKFNNQENIPENERVWFPCDGRQIYNAKITQTPDLRGVFLRGANNIDPQWTRPVDERQKNPDPVVKKHGDFQDDALESHSHRLFEKDNKPLHPDNTQTLHDYSKNKDNTASRNSNNGGGQSAYTILPTKEGSSEFYYRSQTIGQEETRPKNITVNYYIKVR